jgi:UDP-N-acetylmuramate: L-alanyl-gamma-D-glutamyl-meso-diaminopimelate ligase
MGALAGLLKTAGHDVRGSDRALYPPMSDQIAALGIQVASEFAASNLDWGPDQVVVGNTCTRDNVEVVEAEVRGIPLTSFPACLAEHLLADRRGLVVTGTHGKTTTSSLIAHILVKAERDPTYFIGGVPIGLGNGWRLGKGEDVLLEGDEYDSAFFDKGSKFLHYKPQIAILTSVELDHVDIFESMEDVRATFRKFVSLIPEDGLLIVGAASEEALHIAEESARCRVETYAFGERSRADAAVTWTATDIGVLRGGRSGFDILRNGERFLHVESMLFGDHNYENLIASVAMAHALGIPAEVIGSAIAEFAGVRRRQEVRGIAQGTFIIDDYAHHPTAITETLKGLAHRFKGRRLIALYEPRTATSRRKTFQREFVDALAHADTVVVGRLYDPDSIPEDQRFDAEKLAMDLHRKGTTATYIDNVDGIVAYVNERARPGDVVVVLSSGAFDGVHEKLLASFGDAVIPGQPGDIDKIRALLDQVGLDWRDLADEDYRNFLVLRNEDGLVGCIGLEIYGEDAILRSLAVNPNGRGQGYGWMLADTEIQYARHRGVRRIYLLTPETASDFFAEKLGFRVVDVSTVSDAVAQSSTFRSQRGKSPMTMRLDL